MESDQKQERTAAQVLYGGTANEGPERISGDARTAAEVLYGKEAPKEQPSPDTQKSEGKDKDWLKQGAEDAAKSDRFELKLPEGALVDEPLMTDFTKLGREHGFTTEQMQRFADLHLRASGEVIRQAAEYREAGEGYLKTVKAWGTEVASDPEFGGANKTKTVADALSVLNAFGTPEEVKRLKQDADTYGFGNHPSLIKILARIARTLGDE